MSRADHLVSTAWLEEHLDDPGLRVLDATVHLPRTAGDAPASGRAEYDAGHVPGAAFVDLVTELSDPESELHFTRPSPSRLEETLSRVGVDSGNHVVAYSTGNAMWATRLWWLLRSAGVARCSVLDGGFAKWIREGRPVSIVPASYPATRFEASPRESHWATKADVLAAIRDGATCIINALPRPIHTGEVEMGYARPGHITGSENVPFNELIDGETGELVSDALLRRHFETTGALDRERVITYCGGGIAATLDALALTVLGHDSVSVYDGSLSEWSADPAMPMSQP